MSTPTQDYLHVIEHTQLVSLDILIVNEYNQVLLGYRENNPAKHTWFTFGGRIYKEETPRQACERIAMNEIGMTLSLDQCHPIGVYHHKYPNNFVNDEFGTVYIVFAYIHRCRNDSIIIQGDEQHSRYQWFDIASIHAHPDVHPYVKEYFRKHPNNRFTEQE